MEQTSSQKQYISPVSVWALSFGSAVGWGAFVMPGTTFIPIAGPLGSVLGMLTGSLIMIVIAANYHFMMNKFPENGGTYSYTKHILGNDHAFLSAWFLSLVYIAITWANISALTLIARSIFGSFFQFGFYYSIAGYTVYFGEILIEVLVLAVITVLLIFAKNIAIIIHTVFAIILILGVFYCFFSLSKIDSITNTFINAFSTQKKPALQILAIAALSPWAFIGFENVSHSVNEFIFSRKKSLLIMILAIFTGFIAYTMLILIAVPSYGLVSMPVFFGVKSFLGKAGLTVLAFAVLGGIITGIIGNSIAASRLLCSLAEDGILPKFFKKSSQDGVPKGAILFIALISILIPFLGRTPITWIVDVGTIGATIAYAYTSATSFKIARQEHNRTFIVTGLFGIVTSIFFALFLLVPNLWSITALATESYLILAFWSIVGFLYFSSIFAKDKEKRFGKSTIVWLALLFLIFFTSIMWMRQATHKTAEVVLSEISEHYSNEMMDLGIPSNSERIKSDEIFLDEKLSIILNALLNNSLVQLVIIIFALGIMFTVYSRMRMKQQLLEEEKEAEKRANEAKTIFLSNMSHDIRTPMNAIIGYTNLARKENTTKEEIQDFLTKIDASSKHLLALINDVLEMSRIESGKVELEEQPNDLKELLKELENIFSTQMASKKINFTVECKNLIDSEVYCDKNRLNRVLMNLVSNAYKFTPENGNVSIILQQKDCNNLIPITTDDSGDIERYASYEFVVKDSGIGMSKEFAERVFEAFERERTSTVSGIQGTGLGMTITKSILDLMGGEITVNTEQGKGTEFIVNIIFRIVTNNVSSAVSQQELPSNHKEDTSQTNFKGKRLLLVDDVLVNREIATMILQEIGFEVETATNGIEAVDSIEKTNSKHFDAILMDIQMPEMNGYEATKKIRNMDDKEKASIPIIAMTANAFEEDKKNAFEAGMNAHVPKPIDEDKLKEVLKVVLEV